MPDASLIYNKQYLCINGNNRDNAHITGSPFKGMGKLIHIAAWAILFGLPFFFTGRESQTVTVLSYVRSMIVPLSFMLVFYANYFVLIDHFLFAKRPWKFLLCNVVLIAASMGGRPSDVRTAPASRMGTSEAGKGMAGDGRFLHGERHAVYAGGRAKRRHQDDRKLVSDGVVPPGVGEKPCRSRIAESEKSVEPPFSLQHAEQHLQSDRFQPGEERRRRCTT